jgi:hypothetical protein
MLRKERSQFGLKELKSDPCARLVDTMHASATGAERRKARAADPSMTSSARQRAPRLGRRVGRTLQ